MFLNIHSTFWCLVFGVHCWLFPDHQPRMGVRAKARVPLRVRAGRALSVLQLQEPVVPQVT